MLIVQKSTTTTINNNNNKLKHLTYVIDKITTKRWERPGFIEGISQLVKKKRVVGYKVPVATVVTGSL